MFLSAITAFAEGEASAATGATTGNYSFLIMMGVLILVCFILPGQMDKKQRKKMRQMLDAMQIGDEVRMTSGILGKVYKITEDEVVIRTGADHNTSITFSKNAVAAVLTSHDTEEKK